MGYAIFFDYNNKTYRLPVNPEQVETSSTMGIETYEILKLGQIAVPTYMELKKYSFECEFPIKRGKNPPAYVETPNSFKDPDYYLNKFESWRKKKEPVRFIASNGITDDINTLVLIEELSVVEKAGEEGDKYVSFTLKEYKEYGKVLPKVDKDTGKKENTTDDNKKNPKSTGYYVVKSGDTLWAIAKKYYGDGTKYTKIYNANKDKIKNPSLIYPRQKLVVP